jgi:hypothetical protein
MVKHSWVNYDLLLFKCDNCGNVFTGTDPPEFGCPGKEAKTELTEKRKQRTLF